MFRESALHGERRKLHGEGGEYISTFPSGAVTIFLSLSLALSLSLYLSLYLSLGCGVECLAKEIDYNACLDDKNEFDCDERARLGSASRTRLM